MRFLNLQKIFNKNIKQIDLYSYFICLALMIEVETN